MDYFFHQIQRKTRKPAENSVEWRFFIIPRGSFRPWFPMRMERSVESHENIQSFREIGAGWWFPSIPPFDLPAFWTVQEITRPSRNHRFSRIDQKPRTRVTEFLSKILSKMKIPCFSSKTCSVESLIRLRDERTAKIMNFLRNSLKKHRFDLGKSPANWKTSNFIKKSIDLTSVFPLSTRFAKNDVPQSLWFPTFERHFFYTSRNVAVAPV